MKEKFGEMVKNARGKESLNKVSNDLNISAAYLCDIEKGYRFPSKELLDKMFKRLKIDGIEKNKMYDLVAIESPKKIAVSYDIAEYIMQNQELREFIRIAKIKNIKNSYWKNIREELEVKG